MSIDYSYIFSHASASLISFFIFLISFRIYKYTEGASKAYREWYRGTFLIFTASMIYLFFGLTFGCNDTSISNINEFHKILGFTVMSFGFFYLPLGIMYLSRDIGVGELNKQIIKKIQLVFFMTILFVSLFLMLLLPYFKIIKLAGILFNSLYVGIWFLGIYFFNKAYRPLKTMTKNNCWLFLYLGMVAELIKEILNLAYFIVDTVFIYSLMLLGQIMMIISLVIGFFKIAKMLEVI